MVLKECVEGGGRREGEELYRRKRTVSNSEIDWKIGVGRNIPVGIDPFYDFTIHLSAFRHCATALSLSVSLQWNGRSNGIGVQRSRARIIYTYIYIYRRCASCNTSCPCKLCKSIHPFRVVAYAIGRIFNWKSIYVFITKGVNL